jgi:hypothetical protein
LSRSGSPITGFSGSTTFIFTTTVPRQPLSNILALHLDYVTVHPWLIDHGDKRYPGRTKQIKAYTHCLEHDAARHAWITFLDCDEFIVLNQYQDLKAFLADFEGYDSIALNWHVFGHNGHRSWHLP